MADFKKGENFILQKVKNHPELKDLKEDEQMLRAVELTSHEAIRCKFSYLLETGSKLIWEMAHENRQHHENRFMRTIEEEAIHQKAKQDVAQTCHLPVKLMLSKLRRGRPPLANTWSSFFKFEYGPLHAALQVGEVLIEWGRESLVIPKFEPIVPERQLQIHVHGQGEFVEKAGQLVREMSMVDNTARHNTEKKVDVLYRSVAEKNRLIENLIEVIIKYNREYKYDLFKRNCQHFVRDAMAALEIKDRPQFSGKLAEYYELLKNGKTKMPEFKTHDSVDRYVVENFDRLGQHDMEFLLCQYFQHHSPEMSKADNIDDWKCTLATCQSDRLEEEIKQNSLLFNQFRHNKRSPRLPRRAVSEKARDRRGDEVAEMLISEQQRLGMQQQSILVTRSLPPLVEHREPDQNYIEKELPREGVSLQRQDSLLGKFKGYRECIAFKLRTHPSYMDETQSVIDSMVNTLGECEHFRMNYFDDDLCTCKDLVQTMFDNFKNFHCLQRNVVEDRARENFAALCRFPFKFLYHPSSERSAFERGNLLDVPLDVRLQVGQFELEWNVAGLVIPKLVQPKRYQPVLSVRPMESYWSMFVQEQKTKVEEAIQKRNADLQTQLIFELVEKREKLLTSVVQVIVDYNRHKEYDEMRLANRHFVADVCKAVGVPSSDTVNSLQQFSKSQYTGRRFSTHLQLDSFVIELNWADKTASLPQADIQYLIAQYFHFHVVNWEERKRPEHWMCTVHSCQLLELEKLVQ